MTPQDAHNSVRLGLMHYATAMRKTAQRRSMAGPENSEARAGLRAQARDCLELAQLLNRVSPAALADLLGIEPEVAGG